MHDKRSAFEGGILAFIAMIVIVMGIRIASFDGDFPGKKDYSPIVRSSVCPEDPEAPDFCWATPVTDP